jgi:hypothetical protein
VGCSVERGKFGTIYTIVEDAQKPPKSKRGTRSFPKLEAWWSDGDKGNSFLIRQENTRERADVLELSHGQVYDLIDALNRAIGFTGPEVDGFDIA